MYQKFGLADVDGVLCVTSEVADWSKPELHTLHFPTTVRTRDFLSWYEIPDLTSAEVKPSRPGEYYVTVGVQHWAHYRNGKYLQLVDGGRTQSVKMTVREFSKPKRIKCEYRDGAWRRGNGQPV